MSQISVNNLTFGYDGSVDNVFEDVSFSIDTNWKLGFVGRNGRGKTTFLKLLMGEYEYRGSISAPVAFEYFPYAVPDNRIKSGAVFDSIPDCEPWEISRELSLLGLDDSLLVRPFYTLSNGEQTKILLAALFIKENRFLLIDEPTNHLDLAGRALVSRYLKSKQGFILVSHDRAFLDGCVDHILSINRASIDVINGNFSVWFDNKERQDNFELAENEKLKREVRRLEKTAREKAAWSNTAENRKIGFDPSKTEKSAGRRPYEAAKSKKLMKRAKNIKARQESAIDVKAQLLKNIESAGNLKLHQLPHHATQLLAFDDVSISYDGNIVCRDISFTVNRSDRVALRGGNGSGKSSLIKLAAGFNIDFSGSFISASNLISSYVPQDTAGFHGSLSDFAQNAAIDESLFKAILRNLGFARVQFDKDLSNFSAGQKKKTLIAASLCQEAHILIWDEPLNFIDVISRIQIENLILDFSPTILFVEHDAAFCDKIATKSIDLSNLVSIRHNPENLL